jgi:hypothetical protein
MKTKLFTTLVLITLLSSCTTVVDLIDKYKDKIPTPTPTPTPDSGFKNPTIPPNPQGRVQLFSLTYKEYDDTWRPRWPTYFATDLNIGPGSFTLINGVRLEFRSFDVDEGAKRPSYTVSGKNVVTFPAKCKLYNSDGVKVGEITVSGPVTESRLP